MFMFFIFWQRCVGQAVSGEFDTMEMIGGAEEQAAIQHEIQDRTLSL
jgi:hypothetical protein